MWVNKSYWKIGLVQYNEATTLFKHVKRVVEWVHCLFLLPLRQNIVVTCKIGSFLCSWNNNSLQKKTLLFSFFKIKFQNGAHLKKRAIFDLLFRFFSYQGKVTKIPSAHISLTYIHVFCSPCWLFFALQVRFLFGMIPGVDSYSHHFGTINK